MQAQNETPTAQRAGSIASLARRGKPGTRPGTLISRPGAAELVINCMVYDSSGLTEQVNFPVESIGDIDRTDKILWLDVCGLASVDDVESIGRAFGLHRLALEDVVSPHQRPKVEEFDDCVFIVMRMPRGNEDATTEQFTMFLGDGFLLTFQQWPGDCLDPVRDRLRKGKGRIRGFGADYLAYALIDTIVDSFYPLFEEYGEDLELLEDEVMQNPTPGLVSRLHRLRRAMLSLRRVVWPTREALNMLTRDETPFIQDSTRVYFRDCYDHIIQLMDIVETYREIAAGLLDVYLSSVSTRMNEVMKVLTIIATIFIPLSFVAGLFGMNFDRSVSGWNQPELGWYFGYPLALALMALIAGGLVFKFWRKGWIWVRSERSD